MSLEDELIDVHTHVVPENFPAYAGRLASHWPSMVPAHPCHRHVMVSGKVYRTVSHQCWDCEVRRQDMQRRGVTRQVLSPMPELLSPWMPAEDGRAICRYLNEVIATMVSESPRHFIGLGAVPLQNVAMAIDTLDELLHKQGLAGVEIPSNIDGIALGDPMLKPFFQAADAWGAAIFVHPLRPSGMNRLVGPPVLEQVLAFPGEIGLAGASLMSSGLMAELPNLRIALSHGGGSLAMLLPRLRHAWRCIPSLHDALGADPFELAKRFYVDDLVYDIPTLHRLLDVFGNDRVMAGTDYPFAIMDEDPAGTIEALALRVETRQAVRWGNANRWLGLSMDID